MPIGSEKKDDPLFRSRGFYTVQCPYCGAEAEKACFQLSVFQRTGIKKWISPHSGRKKLARRSKVETVAQ